MCLLYAVLIWPFLLEAQFIVAWQSYFFTVNALRVFGNSIRLSAVKRVKTKVGRLRSCQPRIEIIPSLGIS